MAWVKTKNIVNLFGQMNDRFPDRDKSSDGTKGDDAHDDVTSGHNPDDTPGSKPSWDGDADRLQEVRSADIDDDLRDPYGATMMDVLKHLISLPRIETVIRYFIYEGGMYHSRNGFQRTTYTGKNKHDKHMHVEGAWSDAADSNSTFDFKLWEVGDVALSAEDREALANEVATKVWARRFREDKRVDGDYVWPEARTIMANLYQEFSGKNGGQFVDWTFTHQITKTVQDGKDAAVVLDEMSARLDILEGKLNAILNIVKGEMGEQS